MLNTISITEWATRSACGLKMNVLPSEAISTDNITVFAAFIGVCTLSPWYGKIIGYFSYDDKYYKFEYNVHRPKQGSPHLSNKMTGISEIVEDNGWFFNKATSFGMQAFWSDRSMSELKKKDTDSYVLRELIQKITQYSREQNLCAKFRKTDKQALRESPMYRQN